LKGIIMTRFKQYLLNDKMPEPGEVRELINRDREVVGLGIVYGVLPTERCYLVQPLNLDDQGNVCRNEMK
jgi:hypothetical protein